MWHICLCFIHKLQWPRLFHTESYYKQQTKSSEKHDFASMWIFDILTASSKYLIKSRIN